MEFKKSIKEIRTISFNDGKVIQTLVRVDPLHFSGEWSSTTDEIQVCPYCGDYLDNGYHEDCEPRTFTEKDVIEETEFMMNTDRETMVMCINEGLVDEAYLKLKEENSGV